MRRVAITGVTGFLGWHVRAAAAHRGDLEIVAVERKTFESPTLLREALAPCDGVIHLAGVNRGEPNFLEEENLRIAKALVRALDENHRAMSVVFASSTHRSRDTAYGRAKRGCEEILASWARRSGGSLSVAIIPNVFGEHGRPLYNSAVATFCSEIAQGRSTKIIDDVELDLVHAQSVADSLWSIFECSRTGESSIHGTRLRVSALRDRILALADDYSSAVIPDIGQPFDRDLFNSYRSYLFPGAYPFWGAGKHDARGDLFEIVRSKTKGQVFISTTAPGATRGNHYHRRKVERFVVIRGAVEVSFRRLFFERSHTYAFTVTKDSATVDIPTLHTHNLRNVGDGEAIVAFWSNEFFDPDAPDTYPESV